MTLHLVELKLSLPYSELELALRTAQDLDVTLEDLFIQNIKQAAKAPNVDLDKAVQALLTELNETKCSPATPITIGVLYSENSVSAWESMNSGDRKRFGLKFKALVEKGECPTIRVSESKQQNMILYEANAQSTDRQDVLDFETMCLRAEEQISKVKHPSGRMTDTAKQFVVSLVRGVYNRKLVREVTGSLDLLYNWITRGTLHNLSFGDREYVADVFAFIAKEKVALARSSYFVCESTPSVSPQYAVYSYQVPVHPKALELALQVVEAVNSQSYRPKGVATFRSLLDVLGFTRTSILPFDIHEDLEYQFKAFVNEGRCPALRVYNQEDEVPQFVYKGTSRNFTDIEIESKLDYTKWSPKINEFRLRLTGFVDLHRFADGKPHTVAEIYTSIMLENFKTADLSKTELHDLGELFNVLHLNQIKFSDGGHFSATNAKFIGIENRQYEYEYSAPTLSNLGGST